jgi:hypothetical protein
MDSSLPGFAIRFLWFGKTIIPISKLQITKRENNMPKGNRGRVASIILLTVVLSIFIASCNGGGGSVDNTPSPTSPKAWGTAGLVETSSSSYVNSTQVAMDGSGNAMAVWRQYDDTGFSIYANCFE